MLIFSRLLCGVHGGFTRSGGNFRKNNWAKGRLDVGRVCFWEFERSLFRFQIMTREPLADVKFKKPKGLTKHGYSMEARTPFVESPFSPKYCDVSVYVLSAWFWIDDTLGFMSRMPGGTDFPRVIAQRVRLRRSQCRSLSPVDSL